MPIRPENRDRYPPNWREISAAVREEAGQKCEWCSAPNDVMIRRGLTHDGRHVWREASASAYENGYRVITLTDCTAATSTAEHQNAITFDYPMFSEPVASAEVAAAL